MRKTCNLTYLSHKKCRLARGEYKIQPIYGLTGKIFPKRNTPNGVGSLKILFTVTALSLTLVIMALENRKGVYYL